MGVGNSTSNVSICASSPKLLNLVRIHSALSRSYGEPTWCGRADSRRMYSRSESGDGMARNLVSHSRSAFADSDVKPRRSPMVEGARPSRAPRPSASSRRADRRMNAKPRVKEGMVALILELVPSVHLAPAHDQRDPAQVADVGQRIGVEHDQVGRGAAGDRARSVEPEGPPRGRG